MCCKKSNKNNKFSENYSCNVGLFPDAIAFNAFFLFRELVFVLFWFWSCWMGLTGAEKIIYKLVFSPPISMAIWTIHRLLILNCWTGYCLILLSTCSAHYCRFACSLAYLWRNHNHIMLWKMTTGAFEAWFVKITWEMEIYGFRM